MVSKAELSEDDLREKFISYDMVDFYVSYHIAEWYPDTDIGQKIISDCNLIKDEVRAKMLEASKIFSDPAFSSLSRPEKVTIYQSRINKS